jgi:uncharacterized membrane protein (DUF2068 family)
MGAMEESLSIDQPAPAVKLEPLRWIGAYKLVKAALALFMAMVVLRWMHADLPEIASEWMERLGINSESWLGRFVSQKVILIHSQSLGRAALFLFAYAALAALEGVGLIMRKRWAEWLTVFSTAGLIPLEVHECARRFTWVRLTILVLNVAVVFYLVWRIRRDQDRKALIVALSQPRSGHLGPAAANEEGRA